MTDNADHTPNNKLIQRDSTSGRLFAVKAPRASGTPEQLFVALHGLLRPLMRRLLEGQPHIAFEIGGSNGEVHFYVWIPEHQRPFVENLLRAAYPGVEVEEAEDPVPSKTAQSLAVSSVTLSRSTYLPIKTKDDAEMLSTVLATLARPRGDESIHISILVRPKPNGWQARGRVKAAELRSGRGNLLAEAFLPTPKEKPTPSSHALNQAKSIEEKASMLGFDCAIRVVAAGENEVAAREFLRSVGAAFRVFEGANGFSFNRVLRPGKFVESFRRRSFPATSFTLNTNELAALWHLPPEPPPYVEAVRSIKLPAPNEIPTSGRVLGVTNYAGDERPVALSVEDSRRHLHIVGPTGTGKTTLLANLALGDIEAGRGVGIIDPKGDLVETVLARLPRSRAGDVVLITPAETESSVGLNPLEWIDAEDKDLIADNVVSIFKRIYASSWGMRTDDILKSSVITLLGERNSTLCHIPALLNDSVFRARATSKIEDPIGLTSFWRWFEGLTPAQRSEAIGPVQNKLRDFLLRPKIRRLLCQKKSTVDLSAVIDGGGILLADLSTGRWGEITSSLIGSFLFSKIWQTVRARANFPEQERPDFFLYVDEFQQFLGVAQSFADTLAQARSFRLSLTLANQHFGQLPKHLREAVSSNARSRVVFQCGQDDARYLARELMPLDAEALQSIPRYETAMRLSMNGETSRTFTAKALPVPPIGDPTIAAEVARLSRERFARPAKEIDGELSQLFQEKSMPKEERPEFGVGRRPRR